MCVMFVFVCGAAGSDKSPTLMTMFVIIAWACVRVFIWVIY